MGVPPEEVWPWVAQIGADRAGFYSYQWLENLIGCRIRTAEIVHPEWALHAGDGLRLHPAMAPIPVVDAAPGHHLVAHGRSEAKGRRERGPWFDLSWLLLVEPVGAGHTRVISRVRCDTSGDLATRVELGPSLLGSIGGTMDIRMLEGIRQRAERRVRV